MIQGQIFQTCAPPRYCELTCMYPYPKQCPTVCTQRCACPYGLILDRKNKRCVKPRYCPKMTAEGITVS